MKAFTAVSALFQDIEASVRAANRLSKAYAEGVGHPEYYNPYGVDKPENVAMDLAGLYAADSAANILAVLHWKRLDGNAYIWALKAIADGDLDDVQKYIVKNVANATWRAGQPFRGLSTKPLERLTRSVNMQFNELPPDEEEKDLVQIVEGATILLETIGVLEPAATAS